MGDTQSCWLGRRCDGLVVRHSFWIQLGPMRVDYRCRDLAPLKQTLWHCLGCFEQLDEQLHCRPGTSMPKAPYSYL